MPSSNRVTVVVVGWEHPRYGSRTVLEVPLRRLLLAFLLSAFAAPAFAHDGPVTKDELSMLKGAWKDEKGQAKDIEKIVRHWTGAWSHDSQKKMHKYDEDLAEWRKGVLDDLREDGISTKEAGADQGAPNQQRLRDLVVELRDMQPKFDDESAKPGLYKKKSELLSLVVAEMAARAQRFEKRYDNHKDRYKDQ